MSCSEVGLPFALWLINVSKHCSRIDFFPGISWYLNDLNHFALPVRENVRPRIEHESTTISTRNLRFHECMNFTMHSKNWANTTRALIVLLESAGTSVITTTALASKKSYTPASTPPHLLGQTCQKIKGRDHCYWEKKKRIQGHAWHVTFE
jgi:hypothetical protein